MIRALQPATGKTRMESYQGRTITNWVNFLERVEAWIDPTIDQMVTIVDNVNIHRATDVLLFCLMHPRWECVFQPKYAAYLNLIEPW